MTDEQFEKMYVVEVAKLAALQGIMALLQGMAAKQGAPVGAQNWKSVAELLNHASATTRPAGAAPPAAASTP